MKQLSLFPSEEKVHSGILHAGKRKNARPLSHKRPLHLVLKAKRRILYPIRAAIYEEIRRKAEHFGITA
ncbi:hypothetical protein, partial [Gordonia sp. OPL2]|uniref:hypothetical protein n=1 Tax=Gordonia sp. OPL2 TaxID=2486274 RepID=UPI0016555340